MANIFVQQWFTRSFGCLSPGQRARLLQMLSPPLSNKAFASLSQGGWSAELADELDPRLEALAEILVRLADLDDEELWPLADLNRDHPWHPPPRAAVVRVRMPSLRINEPPGLRATDLAVAGVFLAQLQERYRLAMMALSRDAPEPEASVSVRPGSVEFALSASGFGTGVLLVALALSGAALPIAAPAWVVATGGLAMAGPSAVQLIADARKTWFEGSKARDEAIKAREEAETLRRNREFAAEEAERRRQLRPGMAELVGVPDAHVRGLAGGFGVKLLTAYHLLNRLGPVMINARNSGLVTEVSGADAGDGSGVVKAA